MVEGVHYSQGGGYGTASQLPLPHDHMLRYLRKS
jgi:hypothetical protein